MEYDIMFGYLVENEQRYFVNILNYVQRKNSIFNQRSFYFLTELMSKVAASDTASSDQQTEIQQLKSQISGV